MAIRGVDVELLPALECLVDLVVSDCLEREEGPEEYDAMRAFLVELVREEQEFEGELTFGDFEQQLTGFVRGYEDARRLDLAGKRCGNQ